MSATGFGETPAEIITAIELEARATVSALGGSESLINEAAVRVTAPGSHILAAFAGEDPELETIIRERTASMVGGVAKRIDLTPAPEAARDDPKHYFWIFVVGARDDLLALVIPPVRRIALSHDGNTHDLDDIAAAAMSLAILSRAGMASQVVHVDHSSHIWDTIAGREAKMKDSINGTIDLFGGFAHERLKVLNAYERTDWASSHLRNAVRRSTVQSPLVVLVAGPMEIAGRALESTGWDKRAHVTIVSHSAWNNTHGGTHGGYDFEDLDAERIKIKDQNAGLRTSYEEWFWLRDSADPQLRWLWDRAVVAGKSTFDVSDAGMAYWLVTGDENATPAKVRQLLE